MDITEPQLVADSLVGISRGGRAAVALSDIRDIAVLRGDALKTTVLVVVMLGLATGAVIILAVLPGLNEN